MSRRGGGGTNIGSKSNRRVGKGGNRLLGKVNLFDLPHRLSAADVG